MTKQIAALFGVVFLIVGVLGFVLTGTSQDMSMLLGLFPVNLVHNCVHVLFGIWGLVAARSLGAATAYCKIGGVIYLLLGVLGFVMADPVLGLVPLGGNDRWLHLVIGAVLSYAGFTAGGAQAVAA
jgi:hypothetical protein